MRTMQETPSEMITKENGQEFLRVTLGGREYDLPFKLIAGKKVGFLDISGQVSLIENAADELYKRLKDSGIEFDTILNPVSKSNALAHAIALRWSKEHPELTHTVVARKSAGNATVQASYKSVTTAHEQTLSLTEDDVEYIRGKRVLLVDDVFGGGGTTRALMELSQKAGAEVVAHAVIGIEQGASIPEDLFYLFTLPVIG